MTPLFLSNGCSFVVFICERITELPFLLDTALKFLNST